MGRAKKRDHHEALWSSEFRSGLAFLTGKAIRSYALTKRSVLISVRPNQQYAHAAAIVMLSRPPHFWIFLRCRVFSQGSAVRTVQASQGKVATSANQVLILYHYDPRTGKYGRHRQYSEVGRLATMLILEHLCSSCFVRSQDGPWRIEASHVIMSKFYHCARFRLDHVRPGDALYIYCCWLPAS